MSGSWAPALQTFVYANSFFITCLFLTISQANVPSIDEVLKEMTHADPGMRLGANEALEKLARVLNVLPPAALLIHPEIVQQNY